MQGVQERIREFIVTNFYLPEASTLADGESLVDQGVIDSTGVLEVVDFLEKEFGIAIQDSEMLPENLDSVDRIAAFIARKRG
ncbi:MAG TPA: acyl carrier protein [Polyangiaceae bacterium]|nr:acyl carrier protein [Polyangiaceae bacterium]